MQSYLSRRASLTAFSPSKASISTARRVPVLDTHSYSLLPLIVLLNQVDGLFDVAQHYVAVAVIRLYRVSSSSRVSQTVLNSHVAVP